MKRNLILQWHNYAIDHLTREQHFLCINFIKHLITTARLDEIDYDQTMTNAFISRRTSPRSTSSTLCLLPKENDKRIPIKTKQRDFDRDKNKKNF